jgi:hypothetical protein
MGSNVSSLQSGIKGELAINPRLSGMSQKIAILLWGLVTIASLLSVSFSIYSWNVWDRIPATEAIRYFPDVTPENVQLHADWQTTILATGLSLSGYAFIFTLARILGGLSLVVVGFLLIRRYGDHLMAVLMATVLSVFAAAGIWNHPLFGSSAAFAPWLSYPEQVLGWLLWCGAIVVYTFPDGKFKPRWTVWLSALLIPLTFLSAFGIDIVLNPSNWPAPFYLLPNLFFIGGGLLAVLYRYAHTSSPGQKRSLRWYVIGLSLLVGIYFVNLFLTDIYYLLAGHFLFEGNAANLTYVLVHEPIWFACETFFAVGLALSVFRDHLLEGELE